VRAVGVALGVAGGAQACCGDGDFTGALEACHGDVSLLFEPADHDWCDTGAVASEGHFDVEIGGARLTPFGGALDHFEGDPLEAGEDGHGRLFHVAD